MKKYLLYIFLVVPISFMSGCVTTDQPYIGPPTFTPTYYSGAYPAYDAVYADDSYDQPSPPGLGYFSTNINFRNF